MPKVWNGDQRGLVVLTLLLVRFGELGLKSEKVRRRFLQQLADDIERNLIQSGVEHLMEVKRSRIFIDADDIDGASLVLRTVPGIYSFSEATASSSRKDELMKALSEYGRIRLKSGMTYGLKVKRTGKTDYTSHEIAVDGGGAVMSHLDEGSVKVDLKDPDIWFEVDIRGDMAYIFTDRTRGLGGMPASSQGKVLLVLPDIDPSHPESRRKVLRVALSYILMKRRGCRVVPISLHDEEGNWSSVIETSGYGPFPRSWSIKDNMEMDEALDELVSSAGFDGLVFPVGIDGIGKGGYVPRGPCVLLYPTVSMTDEEVRSWLDGLFI